MIEELWATAKADPANIALALLLGVSVYIFRDWIKKCLEHACGRVASRYRYWRYRREHLRLMSEQHRTLHVVGLRPEAERPRPINEAYVEQQFCSLHQSGEDSGALAPLLQSSRITVVLGPPGAGKSTLLSYIVTVAASVSCTWIGSPRRKRAPLAKVPIYVPLRQCRAQNADLLEDILDGETAILSSAQRRAMPAGFLEHVLTRGNAIVLLDGLDEVDDPSASRSLEHKINGFSQCFRHATIIVTSRTAAWRGGIAGDPNVVELTLLSPKQQHVFVQRWYRAGVRIPVGASSWETRKLEIAADREASRLLAMIEQREDVRELVRNPLLLSLICLVHKQKGDLPRMRAALYAECVDVLVAHWDEIKGRSHPRVPAEQMKELLRRIAFHMLSEGRREHTRIHLQQLAALVYPELTESIGAQALVSQIERQGGIMVERSLDQLAFAHQTLQEHFVADYLLGRSLGDGDIRRLSQPEWREPFLLMCGRHDEPLRLISIVCLESPVLALEALLEANPHHLETPEAHRYVAKLLTRAELLDTRAGVTAAVNLLSLHANPFGALIMEFIEAALGRPVDGRFHAVIDALGNVRTATSAAILVTLLARANNDTDRVEINARLARLQDLALQKVLESERMNVLTDQHVFEFLCECRSLGAVSHLWLRYGLRPEPGREDRWADAWALRLADRDVNAMLEGITIQAGAVQDRLIWPYDKSANTAAAWLVDRCVEILLARYRHRSELYVWDSGRINRYALRVLIPLMLRGIPDRRTYEIRADLTRARHVEGTAAEFMELAEPLKQLFAQLPQEPAMSGVGGWLRLGAFFARQRSEMARKSASIAAHGAVVILVAIALLPLADIGRKVAPIATAQGWPLAWGYALVALLLIVVLSAALLGLLYFEWLGFLFVIVAMIAVSALLPLTLHCLLLLSRPGILVTEAAITGTTINGRQLGRRVWYWRSAVACLILSAGALGGWSVTVTLREYWPSLPLAMTMTLVAALTIAAIATWLWARVFRLSDDWLGWLRNHPRGDEILCLSQPQDSECAHPAAHLP